MEREMTRQEELYFATKLAADPTLAAFLNNQVNHGQNFMQQAARLYVCERCEHAALASANGYTCPNCGHQGSNRVSVKSYMRGGLFR